MTNSTIGLCPYTPTASPIHRLPGAETITTYPAPWDLWNPQEQRLASRPVPAFCSSPIAVPGTGAPTNKIAETLLCSRATVANVRKRCLHEGLSAAHDR